MPAAKKMDSIEKVEWQGRIMRRRQMEHGQQQAADGYGQPVAIVTGASSGFGMMTAVELAKRGFIAVATMRDESKRTALDQAASAAGVASLVEVVRLDVTDADRAAAVVASVAQRYGRIDALVNNAGIAVGGYTEEVPMEGWRRQMETNFFGLVSVTQAVIPHMRLRRAGTIINVSSVSGRIGFPGYAPYAASKFAVEGFSESLRHELAPFGIRVVLIEPGAYRTDIWSKGLSDIASRPDSPYAASLERVLAYSRRAAETSPDPVEVAEAIARIASAPRTPRLRYMLGRGSRLGYIAKALLPWRWYEAMIRKLL